MARVVLLSPDLLFGSKVEGGLRAAGHEVSWVKQPPEARSAAAGGDAVVVVDLAVDGYDPAAVARELTDSDDTRPRLLAYYRHTDRPTRERAEAAGFDLVVPRSRMAREMAALVERLSDARA